MASTKPSILIQLDTDPQPSVFDSVVAVDAGIDHLFRHPGVTEANVRDLVYGALFTRGPADLHRTALFIGGSDVSAGEAVLAAVTKTYFGPFKVSVLFDGNGSNTTAAAAVLSAIEGAGGAIEGMRAVVLAGTGPVGQRVSRLLAREGASVAIGSRAADRSKALADRLSQVTGGQLHGFGQSNSDDLKRELQSASVLISCGPAGVQLLPESGWRGLPDLKAAIDLNAVPPMGLGGIEPTDKGKNSSGVYIWGALGVGGLKMKIHKKAIQQLFSSNDHVLDAEQVFQIGRSLT